MRMRVTKNVSITMPVAMVKDAERLAKRENRTIAEAKRNPLAPEEILAEDKRLAAYGARQAKKLGFKERDTVRMIHESRARRNAS